MTISLAEVEYVYSTSATCQAIWMRRVLKDLMHEQDESTTIYCDNKSTIALSKNYIFHKRTKHIDTTYHFIRELINNGEISLEYCKSEKIITRTLMIKQFLDILLEKS